MRSGVRKALLVALSVALIAAGCALVLRVMPLIASGSADTQAEIAASYVLAILSAAGGLCVLLVTVVAERQKAANQLRNDIALECAKAYLQEQVEPRIREIQTRAEAVASFIELEYQSDFRKRERRDAALLKLSEAVIGTTRAFTTLTTFRLASGQPIEPLVDALAQALAARQMFLSAREELSVIRAVKTEHGNMLEDYGQLLIDIIIDLQRNPQDKAEELDDDRYSELMNSYRSRLVELDHDVGKVLAVFIAPQHRDAISLESMRLFSKPAETVNT